jgi:hypothetical protein
MPSHKHTHSVTQNRKAELANAYNELGKELSSSKIRVVGNYTLGRVIGEGLSVTLVQLYVIQTVNQAPMAKSGWAHTV